MQLQEWDFFAVDAERNVIGTDRWFGRWCEALRRSLAARDASVTAAMALDEMVRAHGFRSVQQRDVWMPIGHSSTGGGPSFLPLITLQSS